jgi:hypothetical protein
LPLQPERLDREQFPVRLRFRPALSDGKAEMFKAIPELIEVEPQRWCGVRFGSNDFKVKNENRLDEIG